MNQPRDLNADSNPNRLGQNYNRYVRTSYATENNPYPQNDLTKVFNQGTPLSVQQEPTVNYNPIVNFLSINSIDRDFTLYPSPNSYTIYLDQEYRNVQSIELIDASIPDKNDPGQEPYLLLQVDQISNTIHSLNTPVQKAFAILKMTPQIPDYFMQLDNTPWEKMPKIYRQPLASLNKMTLSIRKSDGTLFDFGETSTTAGAFQNSFTFKIVTQETNRAQLQTRNVY